MHDTSTYLYDEFHKYPTCFTGLSPGHDALNFLWICLDYNRATGIAGLRTAVLPGRWISLGTRLLGLRR